MVGNHQTSIYKWLFGVPGWHPKISEPIFCKELYMPFPNQHVGVGDVFHVFPTERFPREILPMLSQCEKRWPPQRSKVFWRQYLAMEMKCTARKFRFRQKKMKMPLVGTWIFFINCRKCPFYMWFFHLVGSWKTSFVNSRLNLGFATVRFKKKQMVGLDGDLPWDRIKKHIKQIQEN